jgi:hypothetical protein
MMMKAISRTAAAALILASLGAQARQGGNDNDNDGGRDGGGTVDVMIEVQLLDASRFHPTGLLIGEFGIDWPEGTTEPADVSKLIEGLDFIDIDRPATRRDESKLDLGEIPGIGSLFRKSNLSQETVASDFKGSIKVGEVWRVEDNFLLELDQGVPRTDLRSVRTAVIVNGDYSFTIGGLINTRLIEVEDEVPFLADFPLLGGLFRIGEARQKGPNLLIMVTPHVVKFDEE